MGRYGGWGIVYRVRCVVIGGENGTEPGGDTMVQLSQHGRDDKVPCDGHVRLCVASALEPDYRFRRFLPCRLEPDYRLGSNQTTP